MSSEKRTVSLKKGSVLRRGVVRSSGGEGGVGLE